MPDYNVISGVEVAIVAGTDVVGFATGLSENENFGVQDLRTLGNYTAIDLKPVRYSCSFNLNTFILSNDALEKLGIMPTAETALRSAKLNFRVLSKITGSLLWTYRGSVCDSKGVDITANAISGRRSTWQCLEKVVPDAIPIAGESTLQVPFPRA